jgi:peptidoglycan/xylan/chitin deacetylase (PgdA/CDA1 family)
VSAEEDGCQQTAADNAEDDAGGMPPLARRVVLAAGGLLMTGSAVAAFTASVDDSRQALTGAAAGLLKGRPASRARGASTRGIVSSAARRDAARQGIPKQAPAPAGALPGEPLYNVDDGPKTIALTIDDGPSPVYTPQVLGVLEKYKVTAAFSMIGRNAARYPAVAREVAQAGHVIVNHTWDHSNIGLMPAPLVSAEISRASDAIHDATGQWPQWFRAPYGAWSPVVLQYCVDNVLYPLDWSVDPRDWARPGTNSIVSNILRNTRTGSIILEHDGGGNRAQTVAALRIVIPRLLDEGYHFTTLLGAVTAP